jgi:hypothetical protein
MLLFKVLDLSLPSKTKNQKLIIVQCYEIGNLVGAYCISTALQHLSVRRLGAAWKYAYFFYNIIYL